MALTKGKDGRYHASVYIGTVDGKQKFKSIAAKTEKELRKKKAEIQAKYNRGVDVTATSDTFGFWLERWLSLKETEVSENWLKALKINAAKLEPIFAIKINRLQQFDLSSVLNSLTAEGYSRRVVKAVKDIATGVLSVAADNRAIDYNVFSNVKLPKTQPGKSLKINSELPYEPRRALTEEEQRWITNTPHRAQTAAVIMMYAGLRRGELIPLLWSDIDLDNGTISVNKSVEMIGGKPRVKQGGKSENAERIVYIPSALVDYLRNCRHTGFLVCPGAKGDMMTDSAWRRLWDSYLSELNLKYGDWENCTLTGGKRPKKKSADLPMLIPRFTAHWLRHTFVTLLYLSGVDAYAAKEQAGHADIKTTLEIYTHLDKQARERSVSKLDKYIKEKA